MATQAANHYRPPQDIRSVAVVGAGAVGASWAALFLAHDLDVVAFDPAHDAESRAIAFINRAWPGLVACKLTQAEHPPLERIRFAPSAGDAASAADCVQENAPERLADKVALLAELDEAAGAEKVILSSTGGLSPTSLQSGLAHPGRFVVAHPFHPSHLIPLVEIVGGGGTSAGAIDWTMDFMRLLGKKPIRLHAEASGHMVNRLQFALVREATRCLLDGVASAADIDAAVRYGLAPRWTFMGSLMTVHLAGGDAGMQGILDHAGAAIEDWWTPGGSLHLTPDVKSRLVQAAVEVSAGQPACDWATWRDQSLIELLQLQARREQVSPMTAAGSAA